MIFYFKKLKKLIYSSIFFKIKCKIQCLRDDKNNLFDNIDVCDVSTIPFDHKKILNLSYIEAPLRKLLPLADDFVDIFINRNMKYCLIEREVAAVNNWLQSNKLFHIMRDHPSHEYGIVSGMWGYFNAHNRTLSQHLVKYVIDKYISEWYYSDSTDQNFLDTFIWPIAYKNATVHDSYNCKSFGWSLPFPIKRNDKNCYVGQNKCCNLINQKSSQTFQCPSECRPSHRKNWLFC
jgi:hypothetical protein